MTQWDKRIARWRNNPAGVRYDELAAMLVGLGFEQRAGRGSHVVFKHRETGVALTIPRPSHGTVKPVYVREVLTFLCAGCRKEISAACRKTRPAGVPP